jgi:hypothetical protein
MMCHFRPYLESIVLLRRNRKPIFRYINHEDGTHTFYAADRKFGRGSKELKIYRKPDGHGGSFLRMEITLARPFLKANGLCELSDLPKVWDLDLSGILAFHELSDRLRGYWAKQKFKRMIRARRDRGYPVRHYDFGRFESAARGWVAMMLGSEQRYSDDFWSRKITIIEQVYALKRHRVAYHRFLVPVQGGLFSYLHALFRENGRLWRASP